MKLVDTTTAGGLGSPESAWSIDGTQVIEVGDTVAWYHPAANEVFDCAGSPCSLQPFPLPKGHWGSPYRIYKVGGKAGDKIAFGDTIYFDRMWSGNWATDYSLAATDSSFGGVTRYRFLKMFRNIS